MRKTWIVGWSIIALETAAACTYPWFAFAQQQPNQPPPPEYIIPALQLQRNQMMDRAALAEARAAQLAEENQKLKADLAAKDIKPKE